jgi:hypothetical protein
VLDEDEEMCSDSDSPINLRITEEEDEPEPPLTKPSRDVRAAPLSEEELYQDSLVVDFFKEIEHRCTEGDELGKHFGSKLSLVKYEDPRKKYLLKITPRYSEGEKEKLLGPGRQATRYPVYKDVSRLWTYNYAAEEAKRFKATLMWAPPPHLSPQDIDTYLQRVTRCWNRNTGMNEEIALRLLMEHEYNIPGILSILEAPSNAASFKIVQLINQMTLSDPKVEMISYLLKFSDLYSSQ